MTNAKALELIQLYVFPKIQKKLPKNSNYNNILNLTIPKQSKKFTSTDDYFQKTNTNQFDIIKSSILMIYPELENDKDLNDLINNFSKVFANFILLIEKEEKAFYRQIYFLLSYLKSIENLLTTYPKYRSDLLGTANRSSSHKTIIQMKINELEKRLDEQSFFSVITQEERELVHLQLDTLYAALDDHKKRYVEYARYYDTISGVKNDEDINENQKRALIDTLDFLNGLYTKPHEFIKSAQFYFVLLLSVKIDDKKELAELADTINYITKYFLYEPFQALMVKLPKKEQKQYPEFIKSHLKKNIDVKTIYKGVAVYKIFSEKEKMSELAKSLEDMFMDLAGVIDLENKQFVPDKEYSDFLIARKLFKGIQKELDLTNEEVRALIHIIKMSSRNTEGKFPPQKLV